MSECPIGLICELMECRRQVCNDYARPWTLPAWYAEYDMNWKRCNPYLIVQLPEYDDSNPETDHECYELGLYNERVSLQREAFFLAGWWNAIELPYHYELGFLIVDFRLILDENCAFQCHWPCQCEYSEGFHPAVPLKARRETFGYFRKDNLDEYGFWDDPIWFN